jgi:hypothetical protein
MPSFAFGGEERERVMVQVHGYKRVPVGEYYDDNWVRSEVFVSVGAFSGEYTAAFLTSDFVGFREEVRALHESLAGKATFCTLEEQLSIELTGNGRGGIALVGVAADAPGTGNQLKFKLELDQSHLPLVLKGLDEILSKYPPRVG